MIFFSFCRNSKKLKETREKYDQAVKGGADASDLKKQLDDLDKEKKALDDEGLQMQKKEKVTSTLLDSVWFL